MTDVTVRDFEAREKIRKLYPYSFHECEALDHIMILIHCGFLQVGEKGIEMGPHYHSNKREVNNALSKLRNEFR